MANRWKYIVAAGAVIASCYLTDIDAGQTFYRCKDAAAEKFDQVTTSICQDMKNLEDRVIRQAYRY